MEGGEEQRKGATAGDQTEREGPPGTCAPRGLGGLPRACRDPRGLRPRPGSACAGPARADEGWILCGLLRSPRSLSGVPLSLSLSFWPLSLFGAHLVTVMRGGGAKELHPWPFLIFGHNLKRKKS